MKSKIARRTGGPNLRVERGTGWVLRLGGERFDAFYKTCIIIDHE